MPWSHTQKNFPLAHLVMWNDEASRREENEARVCYASFVWEWNDIRQKKLQKFYV